MHNNRLIAVDVYISLTHSFFTKFTGGPSTLIHVTMMRTIVEVNRKDRRRLVNGERTEKKGKANVAIRFGCVCLEVYLRDGENKTMTSSSLLHHAWVRLKYSFWCGKQTTLPIHSEFIRTCSRMRYLTCFLGNRVTLVSRRMTRRIIYFLLVLSSSVAGKWWL